MVQSSTKATSSKIKPVDGELKFVTYLVNYVVTTNPGDLQTNLEHLSKHMLDKLEPLSEYNLYRKQYGNLKECITKGKAIMAVFQLDGTCFKFLKPKLVADAHEKGLMEEEAWNGYQEGRKSYLQKHLTLCKDNNMNLCSKCDQKFYVAGNRPGACWVDQGIHNQMYDFTKDPANVLNCEI